MTLPRTPEEGIAFLRSLPPSGIRLGLDRIEKALEILGHPETRFPALQVAGTNGKGSTCAFAANCLAVGGYRVGLYTSPHLLRVNERIQINGEEISDRLLGERILEVLERYPVAEQQPFPLTFFEFGTLVALWHFSREKVDLAVLETGLGGRLDATTSAYVAVTAIAPISYDHQEYLGNTLREIAGEKAGILKAGIPVAVSRQPREALEVIEARALELKAPVHLEGRDFPGDPGVPLSLRGPHQIQNAALATASLELLRDCGFALTPEQVRRGLATTRWPGRLEEVSSNPLVLLDAAHNVAGIEVLAQALGVLYPTRKVHLVFGVLADKDYQAMIRRLFPLCKSVHLAPVPSSRSLHPARYLPEAMALCPDVTAHVSLSDALEQARRRAGKTDLVLGAGSLYVVGALRGLV